MEPNFSGYVTKANLKCADGRTIGENAFAHQDGKKVPLVYQHNHDDISQVLGHVVLTKKNDGVWGDAFLNDSPKAKDADFAVQHGDIDMFSIWAKDLQEEGFLVHNGHIQEVSLVLAGANPGASIYNVLKHGALDDDDNIMVVSGEIMHADEPEEPEETPDPEDEPEAGDQTVAEVLATLNDDQQVAVNSFIDDVVKEAVTDAVAEATVTHSGIDQTPKGTEMKTRNLFDQSSATGTTQLPQLKHSDVKSVLTAAKGSSEREGGVGVESLRKFVRGDQGKELMHAADYGIENIEILFPDAQAVMQRPTFVDRRQDWVKAFMSGTSHSPFSRVKTMHADITADEARAKGWIKGHMKTEEVFPIFKRVTGPTWVIKKQKLDRQDIIDITSFDVVAWMKAEMRGKLDEEIARAGLFGDGRATMTAGGEINPDKIKDPGANNTSGDGIRAIVHDNDLYVQTYNVPMATDAVGTAWNVLLDTAVEAQEDYMGSGNKTAFMPYKVAAKLLTIRDDFGHRVYRNLSEVAGDMDVARIVRVPTDIFPTDMLCVVLDLADYNFGTNAGGEVTLFDDFDIDFNQYKYLIETYLSGALVLPYSAQVFMRVDEADTMVAPQQPAIANNVVTIPTQTGVSYYREDTGEELVDASTVTLTEEDPVVRIEARADDGYYFTSNHDKVDTFTFAYTAPPA
jgi:HK97 family phage prohead protease